MIFGSVPLDQAAGSILAHSVSLPKGRLRKGITIGADDIAALHAAGHVSVTVAQLEPGDIGEDIAAQQLAQSLVKNAVGLRLGSAGTGRVNIFATQPGLVKVDGVKINSANYINPMITIATVPNLTRVEAGGMVATVKIISYAVGAQDLNNACQSGHAALGLKIPTVDNVSLIETMLPGDNAPLPGAQAIEARVARMGAKLTHMSPVLHDEHALAQALKQAEGQVILILTASATSDIHDVAPSALARAGGTVWHFGMPVDPGNLLFIGEINGRIVIGLPGCARSVALNGADWVLERSLCGIPPKPQDLMAMGVGGLLKEIPTRPSPRLRKS